MFDLKSPGTLLSPSNKSLARISPTQRESGLTFPHIQWSCTYSHTHTEHPDHFAGHLQCLTTVPVNFLSCCFSQQQQSREWIPPRSHLDRRLLFCICGLIHLNGMPRGLTKPLKQLPLNILCNFVSSTQLCWQRGRCAQPCSLPFPQNVSSIHPLLVEELTSPWC